MNAPDMSTELRRLESDAQGFEDECEHGFRIASSAELLELDRIWNRVGELHDAIEAERYGE